MGIIKETMQALIPFRRATTEGPLPLTAARILEWLEGPPTVTGLHISPRTALRLTVVWACVRIISEDVASLPLFLYERLERGKQRADKHPLYPLLHDAPNPLMTAMQFRETLQGHLLTWGNAFANIERDDNGKIMGLWPLRPDQMEMPPKLSAAGRLLYTYRLTTGEARVLTQAEVLHLRGLGADGIVGYSPIALHRETLGWSMATREYGARFFGNYSNPGGVLETDNRLSEESAKRLRTSWEEAHRGLTNAHRVAVLEQGLHWKQIGIPPEDAQYLETMQFQVQDVARIYRVQPHKIAELSRATFSNIEEQNIEYVTDTLRSWLVRWEQQILQSLLSPQEQRVFFAEHLIDGLLRGKTTERYQGYATARQWGWMSANDIRERENMNPIEDGDDYLEPLNMVPAGSSRDKEEPIVTELKRTDRGYEFIEGRQRNGK